jgi:hypothetical protein
MRPLFPALSEDLRYGVVLKNRIWKQPWGFTLRRFDSSLKSLEVTTLSPRPFEFLREPAYEIALALTNERSRAVFDSFAAALQAGEARYEPVLGLHNCPAELSYAGSGVARVADGDFETRGFVPRSLFPRPPLQPYRIGFERLPTYQNEAMWNPPDRYTEVIYADVLHDGSKPLLAGRGRHFRLARPAGVEEAWCLI